VISTLEQNGPLAALTVDASTQKSPLEFAFSADGSNGMSSVPRVAISAHVLMSMMCTLIWCWHCSLC